MNATIELPAIAGLFQPPKLHVSVGFLLCQEGQPVCEQVARSVASLFEETKPDLVQGILIKTLAVSQLSEYLPSIFTNSEEADRWNTLEKAGLEPFHPIDHEGEAAPQCMLCIDAEHLLIESMRRRLLAQLAAVAPNVSRFLILFTAKKGDISFKATEQTFATWIEEFASLAPKPVSLHLVSPETQDGQPLSESDLADALAVAIVADIVVPGRDAPRILTDSDNAVTLSVLGNKAIRYSACSMPAVLQKRLKAELAETHLLTPAKKQPALELPMVFPRDVFARLSLGQEEVTVRLAKLDEHQVPAPFLRGKDYALSFQFDRVTPETLLEKRPATQWAADIEAERNYIDQVTVPAALCRMHSALRNLREIGLLDIVQRLSRCISTEGLETATLLCDELTDSILHRYWATDSNIAATGSNFKQLQDALESAVSAIPSVTQLFISWLLRSLPFAIVAWLAVSFSLPFKSGLLEICSLGVIVVLGHLWWCYEQQKRRARQRAIDFIKYIEREMRAKLVAIVSKVLNEEKALFQEQIASLKAKIGEILASVSEAGTNMTEIGLLRSVAVKHVPFESGHIRILEKALRNTDARGRLDSQCRELIATTTPGILLGQTDSNALAFDLSQLAHHYCKKRCEGLNLEDFMNAEQFSRGCNETQTAFLQNQVINEILSNPNQVQTLIVGPESLDSACHYCIDDNLWASITRVKIAAV